MNPSTAATPAMAPTIILLTSNERKLAEMRAFVGDRLVIRPQAGEILEPGPTDHMQSLLASKDPAQYPEVAKLSASLKMDQAIASFGASAGLTVEDSSFFAYCMDGFPHVLAKSFFAVPASYDILCERARRTDPTALFIVTMVTLERDPTGSTGFTKVFRQGVTEVFIPEIPRGDGWAFDIVSCPNPVEVAHMSHRNDDAAALRAHRTPREMIVDAQQRGLLHTFAERPDLKQRFSPRNAALRQFFTTSGS